MSVMQFPDATTEDIHRLLGYFIYYRFINIAIVAPDTFQLVESKEIRQHRAHHHTTPPC